MMDSTIRWVLERLKEQPKAVVYVGYISEPQKMALDAYGIKWELSDLVPGGAWFLCDPAKLR